MLHCGIGTISYSGMTTKAFRATAIKAFGVTQPERRSANYKPNIWSFGFVQSLNSHSKDDVVYKTCTEKLKWELMHSFVEEPELSKVHVVDMITKLGLSSFFTDFIKDSLHCIASDLNKTNGFNKEDILKTALSIKLLRQHGYDISKDVLSDFIDEMVSLVGKVGSDVIISGVLELFKASHLAAEGGGENNLTQQVTHALKSSSHLGVLWFDVIHNIRAYEQELDNIGNNNKILIDLAKLNFNATQAMLLEELKDLSRWWSNLGLMESIDFSRDRLVESFLGIVGISSEPQHALLRKCLSKLGTMLLVMDDLYDIYGSLEELKCFTRAVERWDPQELEQLPESIKICFKTLQTTTAEIADEIQKEKGYEDISFSFNAAWADFCKASLTEAWWYNTKHIPSVDEYLRTACMTSGGPLICLVTIMCAVDGGVSDLMEDKLRECQNLVYYISLIIRLFNDLETSTVEVERGDSPSSILCYMAEADVTEDMARVHVKQMIRDTWKKINKEILGVSSKQETCVNLLINMGRVCELVYHKGDGLSDPNTETRRQIKELLIQPMKL